MREGVFVIILMLLLIAILSCEKSDVMPENASIFLSADPPELTASKVAPDPSYGETTITARVLDESLFPVKGVGVIFSASPLGENGGLQSNGSPVRTDSEGRALDVLKNDRATTVTAVSGNASAEIDVPFQSENIRPTARVSAAPNPALVDQWVAFDGTRSSDTDGVIVDYKWEFWLDQTCDTTLEPERPPAMPDDVSEGSDLLVITKRFDHEQQIIAILTVADNDAAVDSAGVCVDVVTSIP